MPLLRPTPTSGAASTPIVASRRQAEVVPPGRPTALRLPPHGTELVDLGRRAVRAGLRAPPRAGDHAGLQDLQTVEETGDLIRVAELVGERTGLVPELNRPLEGLAA